MLLVPRWRVVREGTVPGTPMDPVAVTETRGGDAAGCAGVGSRDVTPYGTVTATGQACPRLAGPHSTLIASRTAGTIS